MVESGLSHLDDWRTNLPLFTRSFVEFSFVLREKSTMRLCTVQIIVLFCTAFSIIGAPVASGATPFPYEAHVTADNIYLRSGPSGDYYPTSELSRGDRVEVYWQNEHGWLAVRPPKNSFSWLPSNALRLVEGEHLAEVVQAKVPARIGSFLSDHRNVAQVQLAPGEMVEVLAIVKDGDNRWYKISPPAGEFRWIRGSDIDRSPLPQEQSEEEELILLEPIPLDNSNLLLESKESVETLTAATDQEKENRLISWTSRTGRSSVPPQSIKEPDPSDHHWRAPGSVRTPTDAAVTSMNKGQAETSITGIPVANEPDFLAKNASVVELEIALSKMVASPRTTWQLDPLRAHASHLATIAKTETERETALRLLERIAQFESIRQRSANIGIDPLTPTPAGSPPAIAATIHNDVPGTLPGTLPSNTTPNYDGSGWLMPVVTQRQDVPQYALTDDYGRILKFVTATPGLNLRRYLRKQIAIRGTQRTVPQLYRPHLLAERVVELDQQRR